MEDNGLQDRDLNEKESIALITRMIQNTQYKMEQNSALPMLIWGYATLFATLVVWIMLSRTGNLQWHYFWFAIPVIGVSLTCFRKRRPSGVRTYIDVVIKNVWLVFGITTFVMSAISFIWHFPILFIVVLMTGMGSVLTGLITKFRPFVVGGIVAIILGVVLYLSKDFDVEMLLFMLAFIAMDIIPGHILNYRARKECLKS